MMLPLDSPPTQLCILRLSALGDVCNLVPAVRAIQRHWPHTRITWVIGKAEHSLLAGLTGVEFLVYDKRTGLAGMRALRRQLAGRRFDILLHMQAALRASLLSRFIPARVRLGFDRGRAKDYQWLFTNARIAANPRAHVLDGFMDFARALGVTDCRLEWGIPVPPAAEQEAAQWRADGTPYLLISPCSSQRVRNFRNWSVDGYVRLVEYAWQRYGLRTVLTGGGTALEREYGAAIAARCGQRVSNAIGQTSLKGLLALVRDAQAVIAPDSGPVHMATAMQTPAIGLYASSDPRRTGPYLSQQWVVNKYPQAVQRYLQRNVDEVAWGQRVRHPEVMSMIELDDVIACLDALLQSRVAHSENREPNR